MKGIGRRLFWFVVLAGAIYGVYWLYGNWWATGGADQTLGKAGQFLNQETRSAATNVVHSLTQKAAETLKNGAAQVLQKTAQSLVNLGNNLTNTTPVQNLVNVNNGILPAATSSVFSVPPPTAAIIVQTNTPLVFAINSGTSYKVDWGDGTTGGGDLAAQTTKLLSHAWSKEGDYTVHLDVIEAGLDNYVSFPIRVYAAAP